VVEEQTVGLERGCVFSTAIEVIGEKKILCDLKQMYQ